LILNTAPKDSSGKIRISIAWQMLLGYFPIIVIVITIAVYALLNLNHVNRISRNVVEKDMMAIEIAEQVRENLLGQESYGRRYIIFESDDMLILFQSRREAVRAGVQVLKKLVPDHSLMSGPSGVAVLVEEYNKYYSLQLEHREEGDSLKSSLLYDGEIKSLLDELIVDLEKIIQDSRKNQNLKMLEAADSGRKAYKVTLILTVAGVFFSAIAVLFLTGTISGSLQKLKRATAGIAEGDFEQSLDIKRNDEIGDLAKAFAIMADRLAVLEEMSIDASPLTRLPGGIAIDKMLQKKLDAGEILAFCMIDLDNFKAFNDRYGYAMGNIVIKATAGIIAETVKKNGNSDDFVGHIGGDDFVIITTVDHFSGICKEIIREFDRRIIEFYDLEDIERGYIESRSRQGDIMNFPVMTISIAVVSNEGDKKLTHLEFGEVAAELKKHAKLKAGSVLLTDRRGHVGV
jgi:diguanylate cyclase (GGDEF)-like protein